MPKQLFLVSLGLVLAIGVSGQNRSSPGRMPSTANGEWPHHTADLKGTRYSPLDQINASNFNSLEVALAVQDRHARTASRVQARGHAADDQQRPLQDRRHQAIGRRARRQDG